jgi:hypothetical protein
MPDPIYQHVLQLITEEERYNLTTITTATIKNTRLSLMEHNDNTNEFVLLLSPGVTDGEWFVAVCWFGEVESKSMKRIGVLVRRRRSCFFNDLSFSLS